jgi:N-acetylglucosaminyl-diphospho-decaprenol L-rhamnosyltransferase
MNLVVVVVNYRTAGLAIDCLRSLQPEVEGRPGVRVVVTDNASGDDSVARLEAAVVENGWGGWAEIQPLDSNGGFAYGNNAAIRVAIASDDPPCYIWMLNPDTLVRPGTVSTLLEFLDAHPSVGLLGTRVENPDGSTQSSWFVFPTPLSEVEQMLRLTAFSRLLGRSARSLEPPAEPGPVDWVSGASLVIRKEVFDAVGLLDENYFMYYEEVDFCLRARQAGWPCWYLPAAPIVHLIGQSSGVNSPEAGLKRVPPYWFASRRRYFLTHHGRFKTVLADLGWSAAHVLYWIRRKVLRQPYQEPRLYLWDFIRFNFLTEPPARPGSPSRAKTPGQAAGAGVAQA